MYKTIWISPRLFINEVKDAVTSIPLLNFPAKPWCILAPRIQVESKKVNKNAYDISSKERVSFWKFHVVVVQVLKIHVLAVLYCPEWPTNNDWPSRPCYWPSIADAQRMMSLGCHVVATSAPSGTRRTKPRDSFSLWQNVNYLSLYPIQQGNVSWHWKSSWGTISSP